MMNAVNDALRPLGARLDRMPMTPARVLAAIHSNLADEG
jgi:CO/xanthine dehydrogenase Mo-binding subunit